MVSVAMHVIREECTHGIIAIPFTRFLLTSKNCNDNAPLPSPSLNTNSNDPDANMVRLIATTGEPFSGELWASRGTDLKLGNSR